MELPAEIESSDTWDSDVISVRHDLVLEMSFLTLQMILMNSQGWKTLFRLEPRMAVFRKAILEEGEKVKKQNMGVSRNSEIQEESAC